MCERGPTDVTIVPSLTRSVTPAAAVGVGIAPYQGPSLKGSRHDRAEMRGTPRSGLIHPDAPRQS
jgi:hypothetical protein